MAAVILFIKINNLIKIKYESSACLSDDGVCSFSFLKQTCRETHHGHIPGGQCQNSSNIYAPLDGNKCCDVISIKRCISFWSRSCIDNALIPNTFIEFKVCPNSCVKMLLHAPSWLFSAWCILTLSPLFIVWNRLKPFKLFGPHWSPLYGEKSWNVFIKNLNFFSTEERKTWTSWMSWGWVNYQQKLF